MTPAETPSAPPATPEQRFVSPNPLSRDLESLLEISEGRSMTVKDLEVALKGRGMAMLILVVSLPFALPIPIPVSTPFGIAIFIMGIRIALAKKLWLPQSILRRTIPADFLGKALRGGLKLARKVEKFLRHRRLPVFCYGRWAKRAIGIAIASGGLCLASPGVIPNFLPAISLILLTAGLIGKDGLLVLLGYIFGVAAWIYLAAVFYLGGWGLLKVLEMF